ncbi:hypothetical protein [Amycolatopsis sp. FDAARGOS 1241]|uniref:hypothetical protein n=1 Tax=Amycolatopsis sp. FDAARGOS 1241 TaxID=2778070 RepID=UPI00194EFB3F|nr:hypothetical protein [Amycolatopsis sp. FDAARGOS 1241]QRP51141.1 hypothetical protein I6J71_36405 [Amycolatopsis sp. FDAARGOS 1241]
MTAAESLNLIARQNERTRRELGAGPARLLGVWALAWLVGWALVFLSDPSHARPLMPGWLSGVVVAVLFVSAIAYSIYYGSRINRGIRGPSRRIGAMYGWSWMISFAALCLINISVMNAGVLDPHTISLLWSGTSLLLTGVLYLAGGMLWQDKLQYGFGVWIIVSGGASVLVGVPGNFLVLCLAGGGGFLVASLVYFVRERRRGPTRAAER